MTRDEWLAQIEANPRDWQMALIAADEIEQAGDELFAEQLRFAVQWIVLDSAGYSEINHDDDWCWDFRHVFQASRQSYFGLATCSNRDQEREWCRENNVRFIPAFPRSLKDVYAGGELV